MGEEWQIVTPHIINKCQSLLRLFFQRPLGSSVTNNGPHWVPLLVTQQWKIKDYNEFLQGMLTARFVSRVKTNVNEAFWNVLIVQCIHAHSTSVEFSEEKKKRVFTAEKLNVCPQY